MNNKIIARIMATVICVCMMSTVAFAADAVVAPNLGSVEGDATTKVINFMNGDTNILAPEGDADQVTMMAYLVDGTPDLATVSYDSATMTIIAIDQYDANDLATNVKVLASKLVEGKSIVLQTGDSLGGGAKYLVAEEVIEDDKVVTVTVMNGATAIEVEADANGDVTLPATATFDKTMVSEDYSMILYSWIAVDATGTEGTEYVLGAEPTKVAAADLEDVTLYAKYVCNRTYGDVNGDGDINSSDYGDVLRVATGKSARRLTGKPLFEGSNIKLGDVLVDGDINSSDYGDILRVATGKSARRQTGKPIYYVYYVQK